MSFTAADLVDIIVERRAKATVRAYDALKAKVVSVTARMTAELASEGEIELTDEDSLALGQVSDGLREFGYKYCLIEVQDSAGNILKHKLRISISHLF